MFYRGLAAVAAAFVASAPAGAATVTVSAELPVVDDMVQGEVAIGSPLSVGDTLVLNITFAGGRPFTFRPHQFTNFQAVLGNLPSSVTSNYSLEFLGASGPSPFPAAPATLMGGQVVGGAMFYSRISDAFSFTGIRQTFQFTQGSAIEPRAALLLASVPEPATWAMMLGGFGLLGGAVRRRRYTLAPM